MKRRMGKVTPRFLSGSEEETGKYKEKDHKKWRGLYCHVPNVFSVQLCINLFVCSHHYNSPVWFEFGFPDGCLLRVFSGCHRYQWGQVSALLSPITLLVSGKTKKKLSLNSLSCIMDFFLPHFITYICAAHSLASTQHLF